MPPEAGGLGLGLGSIGAWSAYKLVEILQSFRVIFCSIVPPEAGG